ncbi:unnamed protein product [Thlaspi arvense]|uniref:Uncharacterized protein n=1 Tax=Thlaspi arvense TaxID=13288 RepID=A0AAU9SXM9_THLAR|nr:unnamed protein product [Thlaspi arvense]
MEIESTSADQHASVKEQQIEAPYADWWGFKSGFVSGGLLRAKSGKKKLSKKSDCEDDQENLYNMVQLCVFVFPTLLYKLFLENIKIMLLFSTHITYN